MFPGNTPGSRSPSSLPPVPGRALSNMWTAGDRWGTVPAMHARELVARVEAGQVPVVAVIVGAERFFVDRALGAIRTAVVGETAGFNEDTFEGKGGSAVRILDAARTLPMLASQRFVLVRGA